MKIYRDLDLKKIRIDNNLDFAHFTYLKGQCSCCYGPLDMAARYWKNNKKPVRVENNRLIHYEIDGNRINTDDIQYILFKNANNGSGIVHKNDEIKGYTCISWHMPMEKLRKVCEDLKSQLDSDYEVYMPEDELHCIIILRKDYGYYKSTKNDLIEKGAILI